MTLFFNDFSFHHPVLKLDDLSTKTVFEGVFRQEIGRKCSLGAKWILVEKLWNIA
jgi:hypothetical protein